MLQVGITSYYTLPARCLSVPVLRSLVIEDSTGRRAENSAQVHVFGRLRPPPANKLPEFVGEPPRAASPDEQAHPQEAPAEPGHQASPSGISRSSTSGMSSQSTPAMTPGPASRSISPRAWV